MEYQNSGKEENNRYEAFAKTMIGGRSENQDSFGVKATGLDDLVATVCDGMGGAVGGATASHNAVMTILNYLSSQSAVNNQSDNVCDAIQAANNVIYQESVANPKLRGMGTTATVALFKKDAAYIAHVGDSRIYQLRKGKKLFRTFDHSRVFEYVKAGVLTEEQARTHSQSNIILRALGIRPEVEVESHRLSYKKGDRFVLCCDGVWNCMPEKDLIRHFVVDDSPEYVVTSLADKVNSIGIEAGGHHDNLTLIIVDMKEDSTYQPSYCQCIKNHISRFFTKRRK